MNKVIIGKMMVRKTTNQKNEPCLIICGMFKPQNFEMNEISDNDEMWVANLEILPNGLKFTDYINEFGNTYGLGSPEDFLQGIGTDIKNWKNESEL